MKVLVFIPTFNDHFHVDDLVESILNLGSNFHILVVDDGSDSEVRLSNFNSERVNCFRVPYNVGLGTTTNIALEYAHHAQFDRLVRVDADGQHPIDALPPILELMANSDFELIIGVRANNYSYNSFKECLVSMVKGHMNKMCNWVSGYKLLEWHSGLMVFSSEAIEHLRHYKFDRYPEVEILLNTMRNGLVVHQFEIVQNKRTHGVSSLNLKAGIHHLLRLYLVVLRHLM